MGVIQCFRLNDMRTDAKPKVDYPHELVDRIILIFDLAYPLARFTPPAIETNYKLPPGMSSNDAVFVR